MSSQQTILTVTPNAAIDQTLEVEGFAAGAVNRVLSSRIDAGGKGINVASILGDLQLSVTVTGFLGARNAAIFEEHFAAKGLVDRFVRVPGSTRTGIKIVDAKTRETTDLNFPGVAVQPEAVAQLRQTVEELTIAGGWQVLSGSLPQGLGAEFYHGLIQAIHTRCGHVLLDTSGEPLRRAIQTAPDEARPEIIKPNLAELEELIGRPVRNIAQALTAADTLLIGATRLVVVSMGAEGALFVDRQSALVARPPRVPVVSTVGAGDAMVAGIVWSLLQGLDLTHLARWSTAFGAYAVTRCGAGIEMDAVQALMEQVTVSALEPNVVAGRAVAVQGV
jgi:1-phosphofructokinase